MKSRIFLFSIMIMSLIIYSSCQKTDSDENLGSLTFEITDAPIDDVNVKSVMVTISDIKVNGQSLQDFKKKTVDLMMLRDGVTADLISTELSPGNYSEISLVLDHETDESGNPIGCYLETQAGIRHRLTVSEVNLQMDYAFEIQSSRKTNLLIDFDLRKSIRRSSGGSTQYAFVNENELNKAVRVVSKDKTGTINGNCTDEVVNNAKVIIYAYRKGEFNVDNELNGSQNSDLLFSNALTSAEVKNDGSFELHFLEEGIYELYVAPYRRNNSGRLVLNGSVIVDVLSDIDLSAVEVNSSASTTINLNITGILPL